MLPTVLNAPSAPTVRPLSPVPDTVYRARDGVQVPSRKQGNTKITKHAANAAAVRKCELTVITRSPVMPRITYRPANGIAAIHTAAIRIRLYR